MRRASREISTNRAMELKNLLQNIENREEEEEDEGKKYERLLLTFRHPLI